MQSAPKSNTDVNWDRFDPDSYRRFNYGSVRAEDRRLAEFTARSFASEPRGQDILDVGTGSNFYPLLATLPRATKQTAWEFGASNVQWLRDVLAAPLEPVWREFWDVIRGAYPGEALPDDPSELLASKAEAVQGSIFDLPVRRWDAATMFFCAESITERREEFEDAMAAWAQSVKTGGRLVGAFMENSEGYEVAGLAFPAYPLSAKVLDEVSSVIADDTRIEWIDIRNPIRQGYSGMLCMSARSR